MDPGGNFVTLLSILAGKSLIVNEHFLTFFSHEFGCASHRKCCNNGVSKTVIQCHHFGLKRAVLGLGFKIQKKHKTLVVTTSSKNKDEYL